MKYRIKVSLAFATVAISILLSACPREAIAELGSPVFPSGALERSIRVEGNRAWRINPPPKHKGSAEQQRVVDLAWEVSGGDIEFLYLLKTENGLLTSGRQSDCWKDGRREPSFGFCQIDRDHHRKIVDDPLFFTDERWQLGECLRLFREGVAFYGYRDHRDDAVASFVVE